jgi:hypothetical protein
MQMFGEHCYLIRIRAVATQKKGLKPWDEIVAVNERRLFRGMF